MYADSHDYVIVTHINLIQSLEATKVMHISEETNPIQNTLGLGHIFSLYLLIVFGVEKSLEVLKGYGNIFFIISFGRTFKIICYNLFYRFCVTLLFLEIFEQKKSQIS
jgi:hypothetical protein